MSMASASVVADPPAPVAFTPPPVEVGQMVLWSYGPGERPGAAIVIKVGARTIDVGVHHTSTTDHLNKTGVRHKDDPFLSQQPGHNAGTWDLTPRDKRINLLLDGFGVQAGAASSEEE